MIGLLCFVLAVLASPFKSKLRLEAENAVLRHQLNVVRRRLPGRVRLTNHDRWFLIQLYRWFPSILQVLTIIRPETLVRWHRAGFRCYWRWKSRPLGGRPQIETKLRALIRRMSVENPPIDTLPHLRQTTAGQPGRDRREQAPGSNPGLHRREAEGARHVPIGQGTAPARPEEPHVQGRIDGHPGVALRDLEASRAALFTRKTQALTHRKAAILLPTE
jgi:hypothetical protein